MSEAALTVAEAPARSMLGIAAFRDHEALRDALQAGFGAALPPPRGFAVAGGVMLSCLAPGRYFAAGAREADLPGRFTACLAGLGAVTDQSDAWFALLLGGALVREVLARAVPIDLDLAAFPVGAVALTRGGHLDVRIWHLADNAFEVAAGRSYAQDLRHAFAR